MGLVELETVASLLRCPRCRSPLLEQDGGYRCSAETCALSGPGAMARVGRWPVLVDFESSILRRDALAALSDGASRPLTGIRRWSVECLPSRLRALWKPRNRVAAENVRRLLSLLGASPLVLVVGGGTVGNGIETLYADERVRLLAFDVYGSPMTQLIADAHRIPLADESVDAVVVQAVLEHVLEPATVVDEIHRVLREGGVVYAETPFLQQVHSGAYDFTRFTSSGHRYLFRRFEEISAGPVAGAGTQALWSLEHLTRALTRSELAGKLARGLFFWLRSLDQLASPTLAMDNASAYFFLGRRSGQALTPHDIVDYYRGGQR
jgi:SAM-dependent methyltransferase